ncbi:cysteine--tRNA ligase [Candidatus Saccharibacteria bacterium]|nr:cysteine--tRNA ligase [Candidatus Saccharibacteria bacterium]
MTRSIDSLPTPDEQKKIKMYTCGLTVYSHPHIGNWIGYIYWDVLQRTLEHEGYEVERVQNITDVGHLVSDDDSGEDKMEKGAKAEGLTAWDVAKKYIDIADHEGYELLGLKKPKLVRATDCIQEQIEFVKGLQEKGYTYVIEGEGVYFDTSKLDDYGKLARLDIAGLEAGARVAVNGKKNPTDFALWKFSPVNAQRDMEWESPWGKGFPGWHLECSVIARENLGDQIDIHTGGIDHIPVHHTNEIAQTESLTGKAPFSKFWVHNNHIKVDGQKMSKSLGNIYTLQDILDKGYILDAFKLMVLSKHYRTEGNFTWEILEAAQNRLKRWKMAFDMRWQEKSAGNNHKVDAQGFSHKIKEALAFDLNTPETLSYVDTVIDNILSGSICPPCIDLIVQDIDRLLGINIYNGKSDISHDQKAQLAAREKARNEKNWEESDRIRDELASQGIGINDGPHGQIWYRL